MAEALTISRRFSLSFHDSLYLALAEDIAVPFLHADGKMRRAIRGRFPIGTVD